MAWFLGMQGRDGGWASFDADNNRLDLQQHPLRRPRRAAGPLHRGPDRPRARAAGHARLPAEPPAARRGLDFIRRTQRHDGPWYGRWGVNYIYGTWSVLRGLGAIGEDLRRSTSRRAVRWLERRQNPDGGWGETLRVVRRSRAGRPRRVDPEPDRAGPCSPSWPRASPRAGASGAASATSSRPSARTGRGTTPLERHRLPARLLPEVPPVRASTSHSGRWGSIATARG